jgi:hypothetical protein
MGRACSAQGRMINACNILVRKPDGNRARGRSRRRGEDDIRMDLRKIGWKGVEWIHLTQHRD